MLYNEATFLFPILCNRSSSFCLNINEQMHLNCHKNTNQQMHKESFIINRNTLLHVSTLLGHLQGELFCYRSTKVALYTWVRMCCWLFTALFSEAWTLRSRPALRYFFFNLDATWVGPRPGRFIPRGKTPVTRPRNYYTRGWVGPRAGLDGCGKSRRHRDSISGPSSP
jgi:hypothetical protein